MNRRHSILSLPILFTLAACTDATGSNKDLRAAVDASTVSLRASVGIAEKSVDGGHAIRATLLTKSDVLSVNAVAAGGLREVRVDPSSGVVLSTQSLSGSSPACGGSLEAIIGAAEAEVGGQAVFAGPDDDGGCNTEVKVLDASDTLWEVKVDASGEVVEQEVADDAAETNE